ncbi:MAG: hypothetical protein QXF10_06885 [Ignisphaera sp.]
MALIRIVFRRSYIVISIILFVATLITSYTYYAVDMYESMFADIISYDVIKQYPAVAELLASGVMSYYDFEKAVEKIAENYTLLSLMFEDLYLDNLYTKVMTLVVPILILLQGIALTTVLNSFDLGELLQIVALLGRRVPFRDMLLSVIITDLLLASAVGLPYTFFAYGFSLLSIITNILFLFSLLLPISLLILILFMVLGNPMVSTVIGLAFFIVALTPSGIILFYISPFVEGLRNGPTYVVDRYISFLPIYLLMLLSLLFISYKLFMRRELY